jgi:1-acyl-sn-glycerol-3-phosphate acyltransferase
VSRGGAALWRPVSQCGVGCLPHAVAARQLRRVGRMAALGGVLLAAVAALPLLRSARLRPRLFGLLARGILAALGVRLVARGSSPGVAGRPGALLVANHVSWLDIVALLAVVPGAVMLAKHEVRGWPLIGALARAGGAVFVDRSRPKALPGAVAAVAGVLRGGAVVAAFPEGTTWCGSAAGEFRPALFQAALDGGARIVPVALSYRSGGAPSTVAAFLGGDTLWTSVCRVAGASDLTVRVDVTASLHPAAGADRRSLARVSETAVRSA